MGCVKTSGKPATLNLTWAADAKGYNPTELTKLRDYIDQTLDWLDTIGWVEGDVFCYRVGRPVLTSTSSSEVEELYEQEIPETTDIINGLSVDMIKITAKGIAVDGVDRVPRYKGYNDTYTYKSKYTHKILSNYFIDGVNNATGYNYINDAEYNCILSASAGLRAEYGGIRQISAPTKPLPDFVIKCFTMVTQNFRLLGEFSDTKNEKKGDVVYITIDKLKYKLNRAKTSSTEKFFGEYYEDIKYILEYSGMDQAFKDVQLGGQFNVLDLVIRIPASWENEKELMGFLEDEEVADYCSKDKSEITDADRKTFFDYVFDKRAVTGDAFTDSAIDQSLKKEHLLDIDILNASLNRIKAIADEDYLTIDNEDLWNVNSWFTETNGYTKKDIADIKQLSSATYSGNKGCKYVYSETTTDNDGNESTTTYTEYMHFYVRADWLDSVSYNRAATIYWMGLDLDSGRFSRCEIETIIIIVIVLVITGGNAAAAIEAGEYWTAAMMITAAVISIGLQLGVFGEGKTARNMAIVAAVLSVGAGWEQFTSSSSSELTKETTRFSLTAVNSSLQIVSTVDQYNFKKQMQSLKEETDKYAEDGELYESDLRMVYEDSYKLPQTILEKDPYQDIKDLYKPYSSYSTSGFRES